LTQASLKSFLALSRGTEAKVRLKHPPTSTILPILQLTNLDLTGIDWKLKKLNAAMMGAGASVAR
jgi:hypothetical protein